MLHEQNRWPKGHEEWKAQMQLYYSQVQTLGEQLLCISAIGLDLEPNYFSSFFDKTSLSTLRIIKYPIANKSQSLSCQEHSDSGIITILYQDQIGGLEVQNKSGDWIPVPPNPNALVINIGDLFSYWTNNAFTSTRHRVRNPGVVRYSIPFFLEPKYDAVIKCISGKKESVVYGPWLIEKITREFVEYFDLLKGCEEDMLMNQDVSGK